MSTSIARLKGSIPPLVTPFRDGEVDTEAYAGLVEHQIANGSHGVLVNGTSAEPSTLTIEERNRLVDAAVELTTWALDNYSNRKKLLTKKMNRARTPWTEMGNVRPSHRLSGYRTMATRYLRTIEPP